MTGEDEVPKTVEETRQQKIEKGEGAGWVRNGVYGIALLLVLISTFQLYFSIQDILRIWFEKDYVPVFQSLYFLLVATGGLYAVRGALTRA